MASFRAEAAKAEGSRLRKDLIGAMDEANNAMSKLKEISKKLKVQRMLFTLKISRFNQPY